jgi:hypothetical protein
VLTKMAASPADVKMRVENPVLRSVIKRNGRIFQRKVSPLEPS